MSDLNCIRLGTAHTLTHGISLRGGVCVALVHNQLHGGDVRREVVPALARQPEPTLSLKDVRGEPIIRTRPSVNPLMKEGNSTYLIVDTTE